MGDLVNGGFHRLNLAHALLNGDAAVFQMIVAVRTAGDILKGDGDGRFLFQGFKEGIIVLHRAFQFVHHDVRKLLAVGLGYVEHADHLEGGACDLNRLAVRVQNRLLRLRVELFALHLCLVRRGRKDFDALFALHDLTVEVALPCGVTGNVGCLRLLHCNEQGVVERVVVKFGHRAEVFLIPFRVEQLLDALFQLVRDLLPPYPICRTEKQSV